MKWLWIILLLGCTACRSNQTAKSAHEQTLANYKGMASLENTATLRKEKPIDLSVADTTYWFHYAGRIHGYQVSVYRITKRLSIEEISQPQQTSSACAVLLTFEHQDGSKFQVFAPSFNVQHILQQEWENNEATKDSYTYIPYNFNKTYSLSDEESVTGIEESPFFFGDVDFDGEDELIVCRYKDFAYNRYNCFECFNIELSCGGRSAKRMTYPPFDYLVGRFACFDKKQHTIHTWSRDGAYDIYRIIKQGIESTSIVLESGRYGER
ncbi:MAG: hypothetical protein J6B59_04455 [Alistipes sp.]|nr:hypothetical protein [Alistipes sp.]